MHLNLMVFIPQVLSDAMQAKGLILISIVHEHCTGISDIIADLVT